MSFSNVPMSSNNKHSRIVDISSTPGVENVFAEDDQSHVIYGGANMGKKNT